MSGIPRVDLGATLRDFYAEDETELAKLRKAQQEREALRERDAALSNANQIFGGRGRDVPRRRDAVELLQEEREMRDALASRRSSSREQSDLAGYLQRQGLSPEDAAVMAQNPRIMQTWDAGRARDSDRAFRAEQAEADRRLREKEGARNRATQREMLGQRQEFAKEKAETKASRPDYRDVDRLRGEFERAPEVKAYRESSISMQKMEGAARDPSAAGDLALIFSYMKVLDPGSTVREGEFATAQNAAGVDGRIVSQYNKILSGERLNPKQRQDFIRRAGELHGAHRQAYDAAARQYGRLAGERGYSPQDVVRDAPSAPRRRGDFEVGSSPSGTVRMRSPDDGAVYEIDSAEAQEAAANGWEPL